MDVQCFSDSFWCLPEENNIYFAVCLPCTLYQWPCMIRLQGLISELVKSPTYSGMSTIVVTPPAAAALVALQKPSQEVRPGSFTWTWQSTMPGITTLSPTSSTFQPQKSFLTMQWIKHLREIRSSGVLNQWITILQKGELSWAVFWGVRPSLPDRPHPQKSCSSTLFHVSSHPL